jgi:hypothetical protein
MCFCVGATDLGVLAVVGILVEEGHFGPAEGFEHRNHRLGDLRVGRPRPGERREQRFVGRFVVRAKLQAVRIDQQSALNE